MSLPGTVEKVREQTRSEDGPGSTAARCSWAASVQRSPRRFQHVPRPAGGHDLRTSAWTT